jgi:predicted enzyme related to lactoylglutathione lyase
LVGVFFLVGCLLASGATLAAENGQALWLDLVTENGDAAAAFYHQLFGWEIVERPGRSSIIRHQGRDIAALFEIRDAIKDTPESQWLVGIVAEDLEDAVASARSNGGTILRQITEVPDSGRYAVIRDPQGALFVLGRPTRDFGGPREPGFFVWAELWSDDLDASAAFYNKVLGYQRGSVERPNGSYSVFETGGVPRTGLVATPSEDVKPVWAPYLGVADVQAIVKRTPELGGRVVLEPSEDHGGGRVALIEDPSHAMIFVVQLSAHEGGSR